jgi:hypothetical protein
MRRARRIAPSYKVSVGLHHQLLYPLVRRTPTAWPSRHKIHSPHDHDLPLENVIIVH